MHSVPGHSVPGHIEALIARYPFLTIESSKQLYPAAAGTGLPLLRLNTRHCKAVIAFQGAQLLEFVPTAGAPLLWLSPNCHFTPGTALRGGVPVCLPWFGVHQSDPNKPKHGFARNRTWELTDVDCTEEEICTLGFTLVSAANEDFPYAFTAHLRMILGVTARLELTIHNTDTQPFQCTWALHSYHPVASLAEARVLGLAGREYRDNLANYAAQQQVGDVTFAGEVDRVFPGVDNDLVINSQTDITITHHNCPSVIVWNPGAENAAQIADIGAGQEQHYVCVERGAVLEEAWHLAAGEDKTAWIEIAR